MICCGEIDALAPETLSILQEQTRAIFETLPDVILCVIINPAGEVVAHDSNGAIIPLHPLVSNISLMKRALLDFGASINAAAPCPAVHAKGETQAISCFTVGPNVLGVVSEAHPTTIEWYSPSAAESAIQPFLQALTQTFTSSVTE
mmetsp:Transcript_13765/g.18913  ORF Transcript_13765/g.18913 Transcript_13765/m.18913 type:complete len:146 (+) Transcript_13765:63-500(+)